MREKPKLDLGLTAYDELFKDDKEIREGSEIADENYNDKIVDRIITRNEAADLQGTRDYIIELFRQRRYDSAVGMIRNTYHKDILDYLPQEIVDYYREHKNTND